jgi:hypothetical protein
MARWWGSLAGDIEGTWALRGRGLIDYLGVAEKSQSQISSRDLI